MSENVTIRLYLDSVLKDEREFPFGDREGIAQMAEVHATAIAATEDGVPFMIEFIFPDGEHVRWGTDAGGMVDPRSLPIWQLRDALTRLHEKE